MKSIIKAVDSKFLGGHVKNLYLGSRNILLKFKKTPTQPPSYETFHFEIAGQKIKHFIHTHNVNHPPFRMTERSIELALADIFLGSYNQDDVVEIGAVTPYYWPNRVKNVVDPMDKNPLVSHREDWLNYQGSHKAILSISTFEHIGLDDYGLEKDPTKGDRAVEKLINSGSDFLLTWPGGYNHHLDTLVKNKMPDQNIKLIVMQRGETGNDWRWIPDYLDMEFNFKYGPLWANTLLMLYRGPNQFPHQINLPLEARSDH